MEGAPNLPFMECCGYVSSDMVLTPASTLPEGQNYKLYFDNYFTFLELLLRPKQSKFLAISTVVKGDCEDAN